MKKKILLSVLAVLSLLLCACGSKDVKSPQVNNKTSAKSETLYQHGLDVIALMSGMAANDDMNRITGSDETRKIAENIRKGDYGNPKAVYRIEMSDGMLEQIFSMGSMDSDDFSEELQEFLEKKTKKSIASMINSLYGTWSVAASSIYHADKLFVCNEEQKDDIYIYTYDTGYPAMVTFTSGEGGAFLADGSFIFDDEFSADTDEELQQFLDGIIYFKGCSVERLDV